MMVVPSKSFPPRADTSRVEPVRTVHHSPASNSRKSSASIRLVPGSSAAGPSMKPCPFDVGMIRKEQIDQAVVVTLPLR